jgi:hypothetical protein
LTRTGRKASIAGQDTGKLMQPSQPVREGRTSIEFFAEILSRDNRERSSLVVRGNHVFADGAIVREAVNGCQISYTSERALLHCDGMMSGND